MEVRGVIRSGLVWESRGVYKSTDNLSEAQKRYSLSMQCLGKDGGYWHYCWVRWGGIRRETRWKPFCLSAPHASWGSISHSDGSINGGLRFWSTKAAGSHPNAVGGGRSGLRRGRGVLGGIKRGRHQQPLCS